MHLWVGKVVLDKAAELLSSLDVVATQVGIDATDESVYWEL